MGGGGSGLGCECGVEVGGFGGGQRCCVVVCGWFGGVYGGVRGVWCCGGRIFGWVCCDLVVATVVCFFSFWFFEPRWCAVLHLVAGF